MHFTYSDKPDKSQLKQGDVIDMTDGIRALLDQYYPYWVGNEDYTHLMVMSQTCDLLRRDGRCCRTPYISVAAVKPVEKVLMLQVQRYRHTDFEEAAGVCALEKREDFLKFLERLKNNNEGDYFYLHRDIESRFLHDSCAFLRISVALQREHYDKLCDGKVLELLGDFQAKLGWLVGTIYSRVGTGDWVPNECTEDEFTEMLGRIADGTTHWLESVRITRLRKEWRRRGALPREAQEAVLKAIESRKPLPLKQRVVESAVDALLSHSFIRPTQANAARQALFAADEIRNL